MGILLQDCKLVLLSDLNLICNFECDNKDLNDFFCDDALDYQNQLLGQTSYFVEPENGEIVCAFTLSNDSIRLDKLPGSIKRRVRKDIPHAKSMSSYPATLIGRFGVPSKYKGIGIGSQVMNFIKSVTLTEEAFKSRFIIVDSYNNENALKFYQRNEFQYLFTDEKLEQKHYEKDILSTRFMYFDLMNWANKLKELF